MIKKVNDIWEELTPRMEHVAELLVFIESKQGNHALAIPKDTPKRVIREAIKMLTDELLENEE